MRPMGGTAGARIAYCDDGFCVHYWKNVLVNVWHQQGTLPRLIEMRRVMQALADEYPNGIAELTVLRSTILAQPLPQRERDETNAMAKHFARHTVAQAFVVEGEGFRAATTRMVISGVILFSRPGYPYKTFAEAAPAARWLCETAKLGDAAAILEGCVAEARAKFGA
jgi:hypothetical protein